MEKNIEYEKKYSKEGMKKKYRVWKKIYGAAYAQEERTQASGVFSFGAKRQS